MWYDWDRKMSRLDRTDGQFEGICSSILNSTSPCIQLVRDNKRYIIHTQPRICCVCCDSAHGCGILKKDWLKDAKYLGKEVLSGQDFNKFSIVGTLFSM